MCVRLVFCQRLLLRALQVASNYFAVVAVCFIFSPLAKLRRVAAAMEGRRAHWTAPLQAAS